MGTGPGKGDVAAFNNVGSGSSVFLHGLTLIPGTQVSLCSLNSLIGQKFCCID